MGRAKRNEAVSTIESAGGKWSDEDKAIIVAYALQETGKATINDLVAQTAKIGADIPPVEIKKVAERLRMKQLLSVADVEHEGGQRESAYVMRRLGSFAPLEVAQANTPIVSALFDTAFAREIKQQLDTAIADEGETKPKSRQLYRDFIDIVVEAVTLDELLGSQIMSPGLKVKYDSSDFQVKSRTEDKAEIGLYFDRTAEGDIMITPDCIAGSFARTFRMYGLPETVLDYCSVDPVIIRPRAPLTQRVLPIQDAQSGKGIGLAKHECLEAGQPITITMALPGRIGKEDMPVARWERIIRRWLLHPVRGISPARGRKYGRCSVLTVTGERIA